MHDWTWLTIHKRNCKEALERGRSIIENNVPLLVQEETNRINRRLNAVTKAIYDSEGISMILYIFEMFQILHPKSLGLVKYMVQQDGGSVTTPAPCPSPNRTMFTTPAPTLLSTVPQSTTAESSSSTTQWMTTLTSTSPPFSRTAQMSSRSTSVSAETSTSSTSSVTGKTPTSFTSSVPQKSPTSPTLSASGEAPTSSASSSDVETGQAEPSIQTIPLAQESRTDNSVSNLTSLFSSGKVVPLSALELSATSESHGATISRANTTHACAHSECIKSQDNEESRKPFLMPTFYSAVPEHDPFHNWMTTIYKYMFKTEEICNQPPMTDLNSITEDQLYGFLATLATVHPALHDTPQARWLCSQIPDTPTLADQFLNVHQTKRYKSRKPYHDKYLNEETSWHDEL
ncbi:unnamed protein product [Angiostrongylus costaricensis]|uniref:Ral GTPase-activating protein subunit alpha-2 n=1 Tax=Angiostrongylus costaricensis TaxID=334426 RepID=A0A158PGS3_ANGCS|nr:unnamed protein product [Angiostrongylus costaricensis]